MFKSTKPNTVGIHNLGNTCYMNTILQCIAFSPSVLEYITDREFDEDLSESHSASPLTKEFRKLLVQLWIKQDTIAPQAFKRIMDGLMVRKRMDGLLMGHQNDSHEFMVILLDELHNALQYKPNITIDIKNKDQLTDNDKLSLQACTRWKDFFKDSYSKIIDLFYGQFVSEISQHEKISYCFDPFNILSLEIPDPTGSPTQDVTLEDCLEKFIEAENVQDASLSKKLMFWKTPRNLVIHLKRFSFEGHADKKTTRVRYASHLDLGRFSKSTHPQNQRYQLYGICCHHGNNFQMGHYTAICKKRGSKVWLQYNDHESKVLSDDNALPLTSSAYILFYHLIDKKNK